MRALVLRHVACETLAGFAAPLAAAGYAIEERDVAAAPMAGWDWCAPDLVVSLGGPQAVYEGERHSWIATERAGLAARVAAGRPTLGICLGAQLLAAALGARVYPADTREIGFEAIALSEAGEASPLRHLAGVPVLHWHGDTFELPDGTEHLAASRRCANQAFRRGTWLLALQFHPEMGEAGALEPWLADADAYFAGAGTDRTIVGEAYARHGAGAVSAGRAMLAEWLAAL